VSKTFSGMPLHTLLVRHAQKNSKFVPRQMFRFNTQSISDEVDFDMLSLITIQPYSGNEAYFSASCVSSDFELRAGLIWKCLATFVWKRSGKSFYNLIAMIWSKKTFVSPNLRRNPFNNFKIFQTVRMERVFKPIFSLVLSGYEFRPPCQLDRTDWFNFQTEISGHFVTGDWNGQIIQEKRWTNYPEAFRVGHRSKPFHGPKFPHILVEWSITLES